VSKGSPVEVPDVTGDDPNDARAELEEAGLKVEIAADRVTPSTTRARWPGRTRVPADGPPRVTP